MTFIWMNNNKYAKSGGCNRVEAAACKKCTIFRKGDNTQYAEYDNNNNKWGGFKQCLHDG